MPLNFAANIYTELINWQECQVMKPPLISNMSNDKLNSMVIEKGLVDLGVIHFPCYTQATERCIKLVTEAYASCSM